MDTVSEAQKMGMTKTRQPSGLNLGLAQKRAAMNGVVFDHAIADVLLLLEELDKPDHERDGALVEEVRTKYGQVRQKDPTL